ncbi:NAD-dependent epimerase/dehydratase family protein [Pedosphaera parvula]|uniref:NAD-dependent epimerase/dehydratase n=1 Tax=Pedosphaera parvula (strain Ellin514) TaxID=320771 RepID=B9XCL7_PEDPL|nr:NAD-dependent epimerase/dehydratase family protein [Pedosphaera parvula]EEF62685.1 NAD-dependent epimerase/dehydratase [Pedosphaera parvula Ellin514]
MKLLILGGTKFLGRHLTQIALARGHAVTLFNRGQSNPGLFSGVEELRGDREGNLESLKGRRWDAVIDTSGYVSAKVRATAELLASAVEHYTFISSVSVYADFSVSGLDETASVATLPPGAVEEESNMETYGARKALCEHAAEESMPGRVLKIRPGVIVGPYDPTDRFTYWVRRIANSGETLAPENPEKPMQLIDARDLADWTIRMVEKREVGLFNATGPQQPLTFGSMLEACKTASDNTSQLCWIAPQFLLDKGVAPWSDLPLWIPEADKEYAGFFQVNSNRAFNSDLVCRPLVDTARDILVWDRDRDVASESIKSVTTRKVGLTPEREQELLCTWKTKK